MASVFVRARSAAGFRRIGRLFTEAGEIVEVDDAALAILRAEPMLDVRDAADAPPHAFEASAPEHEVALREAVARIEALERVNAQLDTDNDSLVKGAVAQNEIIAKAGEKIATLEAEIALLHAQLDTVTAPAVDGDKKAKK